MTRFFEIVGNAGIFFASALLRIGDPRFLCVSYIHEELALSSVESQTIHDVY